MTTQNRYKKHGDYIFDRWIFKGAIVIIFLALAAFAYKNNFDLDYYKCGAPPGETCDNPFYRELSWKDYPTLIPGEYGKDPSWVRWVEVFLLIILTIAIVTNHLCYNKGKKPIRGVIKIVQDNNND